MGGILGTIRSLSPQTALKKSSKMFLKGRI